MIITLSVLFLLGALTGVESTSDKAGQRLVERRFKGLKFGGTLTDYIRFKPRMEPLEESYTVCAWVKSRRPDRTDPKYWFDYGTSSDKDTLYLSVDGYFRTLGTKVDMRSKVTVQLGTWRHVCYTWSLTTRAFSAYYDGVLLGSATTPSGRKIGLGGYMVIGQYSLSYGGGFEGKHSFGGELFKLNVFDKELDASAVKEMADGGLCSEVEEKYGRSRYLKWEDLLLEEVTGDVTEIDVGCTPELKEEEKSNISEDCKCEKGTTLSRWDLLRGDKFFNRSVTVELVEELKETWDILGEFLIMCYISFLSACKSWIL